MGLGKRGQITRYRLATGRARPIYPRVGEASTSRREYTDHYGTLRSERRACSIRATGANFGSDDCKESDSNQNYNI